jgi:hypothetical protein
MATRHKAGMIFERQWVLCGVRVLFYVEAWLFVCFDALIHHPTFVPNALIYIFYCDVKC